MGLGAYPYVSLLDARQQAYENRKIARAGGDPVALKWKPDVPTFAEAVETVIAIHREGWKDSFASHAVLQGVPLPVVSRLLGHKRPSMTLRYAHVSDRETEAAAERIGVAIALALDACEAGSPD